MNCVVTGGSGFIGRALIRHLREKGDAVAALAHSAQAAVVVGALGAEVRYGDMLDRDSLAQALHGAEVLFHLAGTHQLGVDAESADSLNVTGSRNVLEVARELGIPRIVCVSTLLIVGDTGDRVVSESEFDTPRMRHRTGFRSPMLASKWRALYDVVWPLRDAGLPVITVIPGLVYGPQDGGLVGEMMRWHYRRSPVLAAPESRFCFVHVDDLAAGLRLAALRAEPGETFLMAGESFSLREMFALWSSLTGKNHRPIALPARWLRPFAPLVRRVERIVPLPPALGNEAFRLFGIRQQATSARAEARLGWQTRSLQSGMLETFRYLATRNEPELINRIVFGRLGLLAAAALTGLWLFGRRFRPDRSQ